MRVSGSPADALKVRPDVPRKENLLLPRLGAAFIPLIRIGNIRPLIRLKRTFVVT